MPSEPNNNLYDIFSACFPADMDGNFLQTNSGETVSYAMLERESARIANYLVELGARPGDRVTVQVDKSPAVICLYLACLRAGLVYHPLNNAYQRDELAYFLGDAKPRIVVCTAQARPLFESLAEEAELLTVLTLNSDQSGSLRDGAKGCGQNFETVSRKAGDLAALLYSSGTTGRPKGIMLSHENLAANGKTLVKAWGFTQDDCLLHALPIFHVHGLFVAIHCVLLSGARLHWLSKFDADEVIAALPRCTVMMGVPTFYTRLLASPALSQAACDTMRLFISGSAPLLTDTFEAFSVRTGHTIVERYGMSETGMNTTNPLRGERRAGTVGPALPGVELRVVNERGVALNAGEAGNLQVRGRNVFSAYWQLPEKTAQSFTEDGFFDTGDKARISADGYVSIVGRSKDMIICGGLNVYPKEIELLLDELPQVLESAVIGVPHADFGEAVVAVLVLNTGCSMLEQDIIGYCKPRIANFKLPKRVFVIDALPRNTMGKVQKNLLRERYANACQG